MSSVCLPSLRVCLKFRLTVLLVTANLLVIKAYPQPDLRKGLVACYFFSGNAADSSHYGNHGKVYGATLTTDRYGNMNRAYLFNGKTHIEIPSKMLANRSYSVSIWFCVSVNPGKGEACSMISVGDPSNRHQSLGIVNTYSSSSMIGTGGGGAVMGVNAGSSLMTEGLLKEQQWYHMVYIRTPYFHKLYMDGKLFKENQINHLIPYFGDPVMAVIGQRNNLSQGFKGKIDDVYFYNRVLGDNEVVLLYNGGLDRTRSTKKK